MYDRKIGRGVLLWLTTNFTGHRTRTVHAFGMVVLEILGTKIEDSGEYTCRATNKWGRAEISVKLECVDKSKGQKPRFTTQIQVGLLKDYSVTPKDRSHKNHLKRIVITCSLSVPARISWPIRLNSYTCGCQNLVGLKDGDSAHFECTLVPVNDPDLKVEWFHNGVPIRHSSRIKTVSDFGFVVMDIAYVQSHDSGEYICKASNK